MRRRELLRRGATAAAASLMARPMMTTAHAAAADEPGPDPLATLRKGHPRLLATPETWDAVRKRRAADPRLDAFLKRGEAEARALLGAPPVTYQKTGRRLLTVSRTVLRRVLLLALHYRLTGDDILARRAEDEMRAAAVFADWNPSHFLDVGEMTAALAIGYDWLHDRLTPDGRAAVRAAIVEKGLREGLAADHSWLRAENNWNQVCLGGLTLGALAIADEEPDLAARTLALARANNAHGLKPYAPDGVYPEGPMYWDYGTSFQAVLLDALRTALGTDWGLSKSPGFLASAEALNRQIGPTGAFFNFSDCSERPGSLPALWWFAKTLNRPDLLRREWGNVRAYAESAKPPQAGGDQNRLLPLVALWWPDIAEKPAPAATAPDCWLGRGENPIATFRGTPDGDPRAMYLAVKGGGAPLNHAHMDAGAFVFEADGVRWAADLGMQNYDSLESKGVKIWDRGQDADRWKVFRLGPFCHNTLTVNGALHHADGVASIIHFSGGDEAAGAIVDLTPVFQGQAARAVRGVAFRPGRHVLIRDEMDGLKPGDVVRWAMLTKAEVALAEGASPTDAVLTQSGEKLRVRLLSLAGAVRFEVLPAEPPKNDYDAPNPGVRLLVVHAAAPASGKVAFGVVLQPGSAGDAAPTEPLAAVALGRWPFPAVKPA
jgi:hypothetical protein